MTGFCRSRTVARSSLCHFAIPMRMILMENIAVVEATARALCVVGNKAFTDDLNAG